MLNMFKKDLETLPHLVRWLQDGPERTRGAVLKAKRRLVLIQAPLAFAILGMSMLAQMIGWVERRGAEQFIAHWLATLIFIWPPTFLPLSKAAKLDALTHVELGHKLNALSVVLRLFAGFALLALLVTLAIFVEVQFGS